MYSNKVWISDLFFSYSRLTSSESFDWKFVTWWLWLQSRTCICLGWLKWYLRVVLSPAVKGNWNYCNPGCSCGTYPVCVPILSPFVSTWPHPLYEQGEVGLSLLLLSCCKGGLNRYCNWTWFSVLMDAQYSTEQFYCLPWEDSNLHVQWMMLQW